MRTLIRLVFLVILVTAMSACLSWKFFKDDDTSSNSAISGENGPFDPQVQYGGQFRVRAQASGGINQ